MHILVAIGVTGQAALLVDTMGTVTWHAKRSRRQKIKDKKKLQERERMITYTSKRGLPPVFRWTTKSAYVGALSTVPGVRKKRVKYIVLMYAY